MPMRVAYHIHQHINTISNNTAMDFSSAFQPIIAFVALLLLRALYKIAGHPKQSKKRTKFPFPEPSGALPFIGHLHLLGANKPVARILGAMADKYGPIFSLRLGQQRTLIVSNWEMVKECLTTNDRIFATRPGIAVGKYIGYNNASFALSPYGHYWRDIRKMATLELFSTHRLELLKRVRVSEVDSFIKELFPLCTTSSSSKSETVVVPLSEMLEHLTFNLNLRLIVGKRFSEHMFDEKDSEVSRFKNAIKQALYLSGVFVWSDAIPWLEWLDIHGHVRSMKKTSKEIDAVLSKWLEDHKERKRECCGSIDVGVERDLMEVMLSTLSDEDVKSAGFTRDTVIKANALILLLTGTESTAVTLTWTLSLLLNNPKALKAAQEEMDIHVGRNRWVDESDIPKLQYLQAILKESLRINPAGPITGPREAMEDCYIANQFVPKGTRLTVNIWKLHRDPQIWSDPCEFRPERFLTTHADVGFKGQNFEYIPFSLGRRSCPGTTLGLIVVQSVLARLIQGFDMRTKDGEPVDMSEGLGIALPKATPLKVVLSPRLPLELYESL